jgi:serine/arginine repetitive matrix protein 2
MVTAKSPPPPATSHSRLKLTKLQPSSVGTSPGWTRPSSATPSLAPSPVSSSMSSAPPPAPAPASHGPPQLPHVGKVIQPQPRGVIQAPMSRSEFTNGSSKPAWRNVKQGGSAPGSGPPPGVQSEFPTAAEVAQGAFVRSSAANSCVNHLNRILFVGRLNGVQEKKQSDHAPATPSSATTEADTFRGVHLDPNTHHWDEVRFLFHQLENSATDMSQMEEDNDDFLEGVIEFGDGRSYQIQPVDVSQTTQDTSPTSVPAPEISSPDPQSPSAAAGINKEDRFTDDMDRSWPRSAALSSNIRPRVGPPAGASTSSNSSLSPQEASRVLFNERSNRLEPWSSSNRVAPSTGKSHMHLRFWGNLATTRWSNR